MYLWSGGAQDRPIDLVELGEKFGRGPDAMGFRIQELAKRDGRDFDEVLRRVRLSAMGKIPYIMMRIARMDRLEMLVKVPKDLEVAVVGRQSYAKQRQIMQAARQVAQKANWTYDEASHGRGPSDLSRGPQDVSVQEALERPEEDGRRDRSGCGGTHPHGDQHRPPVLDRDLPVLVAWCEQEEKRRKREHPRRASEEGVVEHPLRPSLDRPGQCPTSLLEDGGETDADGDDELPGSQLHARCDRVDQTWEPGQKDRERTDENEDRGNLDHRFLSDERDSDPIEAVHCESAPEQFRGDE